jgi:protein involved in polysaccharide export with SLBB domain
LSAKHVVLRGVRVKLWRHIGAAPGGWATLPAIATVCCLGACTTATDIGTVHATPLADALALSKPVQDQAYVIAPTDDLTVRFYFNPQLDEDLRVRPDGKISLSLVGELTAAGKAPAALSDEITASYARYLAKPKAVVLVRRFANDRAFVAGEVYRPGLIDMNMGRETALQSIASAGGVTDNATLADVVVVRRVPDRDQPLVLEVNLLHVLDGTHPDEDIALLPNDLVYVPRSGAAATNLALKQYFWNNLNLSNSAGFTGVKTVP